MNALLKRFSQSPFVRSVALLSGGNTVAMALPILAAPVLGRMFQPQDYGALAIFMAPAAILSIIASLQFQYAIISEKTDRSAAMVAWLAVLSPLPTALLTGVLVVGFWPYYISQLAPGAWFFVSPFLVALSGLLAAGSFVANRHKRYRMLAMVQLTSIAASLAVSITAGFLGLGQNGLIASYLVGQVVQLGFYGWFLSRSALRLPAPSAQRLKMLARRHKKFPIFSLPGEAANQLSLSLPVYALSAAGAYGVLGAYTRANQLVSLPVTVLGQSVASVFRQQGAELYNATGSCRGLMMKVALSVTAISLPIVLVVLFFGPELFGFYLGPDWREAGDLARILAPMLLFRNVSAPMANVYLFTGKQGSSFAMRALLLGALLASNTFIFLTVDAPAYPIVVNFSIMYSVYYLVEFAFAVRAGGP